MGIWTIFYYELLKLWRSKVFLMICFLLPLLFIAILGSALKDSFAIRDNDISNVKVAIYSEDTGGVSESLSLYLDSPRVNELIQPIYVASKDDVMMYIKEGKSHFGVFIPSFSSSVESSPNVGLELFSGYGFSKNITAQTVFGTFVQLMNQNLEDNFLKEPLNLATTDEISVIERPKNFTALQYYSVHMLLMFLMFSSMMGMIHLFLEQKNMTLMRLSSVPIPFQNIFIGKLLAFGLLSFLQSIVIIFVSRFLFNVDWGPNLFQTLMVILMMIVVSLGIFLFLAYLCRELNGFIAISNTMIIFVTFLAGGFYPGMGDQIEAISNFIPNYWASSILLYNMLNPVDAFFYKQLAPLVVMGIVIFSLSFILFKNKRMGLIR